MIHTRRLYLYEHISKTNILTKNKIKTRTKNSLYTGVNS